MMPRINLPVMCKSFRYTAEQYGCAKHGNCKHTADWTKCGDFLPVARAGTPAIVRVAKAPTVVMEDDEFAEHCPCSKKSAK